MEDQVTDLKAKLYDKSEELLEAQKKSEGLVVTINTILKALQEKLELTDEDFQAYGSVDELIKELEKLVLIKEDVEL